MVIETLATLPAQVLLRSRALETSVERCLACRLGGDGEAAALAAVLGGALAPASPAPGLVASAVTRLARLLGSGEGLQARSCSQSFPEQLSVPARDRVALQGFAQGRMARGS